MYLVEKWVVLYRVFKTFHHKTEIKTLKNKTQNTE
jgi:hypothetical protein